MGGDRQTDIGGGDIGQRRASKLRPSDSVGRTVSGERGAAANELDPVRGTAAGRVVFAPAAVARTVLPRHAIARRHSNEGVGRAGD